MTDGWQPEVLDRVQALLDRSLERAGPVQRSFFGKPERRLDAAGFLDCWNSIYMCAVSTAGPAGWPHTAAIKLEFDPQAQLSMLLYLGSTREADLHANPRVALQKQDDDGRVLTVYARAGFREMEPVVDRRGRSHVQVTLTPVRAYGLGPYVSGPLARGG